MTPDLIAHGLVLDMLLSYTAIVRERGLNGAEALGAMHDVLIDVAHATEALRWRDTDTLTDTLHAVRDESADAWVEAEVARRRRDVRLADALVTALDVESDDENPDTEIDVADAAPISDAARG